jgi:uncharacterized protein (UPF0332 family)
MPTAKHVTEVSFLKISGNHQEFASKLRQLQIPDGAVVRRAAEIAAKWFGLAEEHLRDARQSQGSKSPRSAYSRAYYAAYNASKAVRFMHKGMVSLHGDDHAKANELPDDFADSPKWSKTITDLYADRLRADYDNWDDTTTSFARPPNDAIALAEEFLSIAREYLKTKHGVTL